MSELFLGKVKRFNRDRGFGFIGRDDGEGDVFFHQSDLLSAGQPDIGDKVRFSVTRGRDGRYRATGVEFCDAYQGAEARQRIWPAR